MTDSVRLVLIGSVLVLAVALDPGAPAWALPHDSPGAFIEHSPPGPWEGFTAWEGKRGDGWGEDFGRYSDWERDEKPSWLWTGGWDEGKNGWGFDGWKKGDWHKDPDCDPPVATPEPVTLLLLGASMAGAGLAARRRGRSAGPRA